MPSKTSLLSATLLGSASILSGFAFMGAGSPEVFRACYVPNTGVVYRIGLDDTAETCRSDRHVEFSWTDGTGADHGALTGLEDDDHPQYLRADEVPSPWDGIEHVSTQPSFGVGAHSSVTIGTSATCPVGKVLINGGYAIASPNDIETVLKSSGPSSERQWSVSFLLTNPRDEHVFPIPLQVTALCVNGPPAA